MNNYNNPRPPRKGVIVFASVVFLSIFVIAILDAYEQKAQALGHSVHLSPSSANYGTVSSAPITVAVPMRSTAPMLSGGAIRSYAYSGHASMPKTSGTSGSGFKIHTTSSASVHSYGSGGGGGGSVGAGGGSSSSSSSRGIQSSGVSYSMPSLAVNSFVMTTPGSTATTSITQRVGQRRAYQDEFGDWYGDYNGEYHEGDGWWNARTEEWSENPFDGAIKIEGGVTYKYVGTYPTGTWVVVGDQADPGVPIGDTPWFWMIILLGAYACTRYIQKKKTA